MPIAAALMWGNTWLPWPRTPKGFKALTRGKTPWFHIPAVFGLPGRAAPRAGSGASAAPRPLLGFVRIARGPPGLGMLRGAQRGAGRSEAGPAKSLHSLSHRLGVLLPPDQISFKVCHQPASSANAEDGKGVNICRSQVLYCFGLTQQALWEQIFSVIVPIRDKKVLRGLNALLLESL